MPQSNPALVGAGRNLIARSLRSVYSKLDATDADIQSITESFIQLERFLAVGRPEPETSVPRPTANELEPTEAEEEENQSVLSGILALAKNVIVGGFVGVGLFGKDFFKALYNLPGAITNVSDPSKGQVIDGLDGDQTLQVLREYGRSKTARRTETSKKQQVEKPEKQRTPKQTNTPTGPATTNLLELIAEGEGTTQEDAESRGFDSAYDIPFGYGVYEMPDKPLSQMTLVEVKQFQKRQARATRDIIPPKGTGAVGKYQFTETTLSDLTKNMDPSTIFSPQLQDQLALVLIERVRPSAKQDTSLFADKLAGIWASLPNKEGQSVYGQPVGMERQKLETAAEQYIEAPTITPLQEVQARIEKKETNPQPVPFLEVINQMKEQVSGHIKQVGENINNQGEEESTDVTHIIFQPVIING